MSQSRLRSAGEAIGVLAVVASLGFVGLEIRQNSEATRAATVQSLQNAWLDWNLTMADPALWSAVARLEQLDDLRDASYEDGAAVSSLMRSLFATWSNAQYQHLNGHLDSEYWEAMVRNMKMNVDAQSFGEGWTRLVIWYWEINRPIYPTRFQTLFDELVEERGAP